MNLKKTLSKDYNLLNFCSIAKQPVMNEMRDGPKRIALEKRILAKTNKIKELTAKINGLNKVN